MTAGIRVIVADDSALARALLRDFLESDPGISVVGEAANGREAVDLIRRLRPDLVTMDLEMPVMGGLEAIEEIMATHAVPILVISGVADAQRAYEALLRGALEVIDKPETSPDSRAGLIDRVRLLAGIKTITHLRVRRAVTQPSALPPARPDAAPVGRVFAIAASTGGPQVLASILAQLPAGFPCPIVIAQHISDGFAVGMADWLATVTGLKVVLAQEGMFLSPGVAVLSPSEAHLIVAPGRRLALRPRSPRDLYRPSCDALFASVAAVCERDGVGIILTGMGHDGADGLARIRDAGGVTLAQDEASSVIFGMNRVAIERGSVQRVVPADRIAAEMIRLAGPVTAG